MSFDSNEPAILTGEDIENETYPKRPAHPGEKPVYVIRGLLSVDDVAYNVRLMRVEAAAMRLRANDFEMWGKNRRRRAP